MDDVLDQGWGALAAMDWHGIASSRDGAKPYNALCRNHADLAESPDPFADLRGADLVFLLSRPAPVDYAVTFVLYCVVGITDYFDGYLARALGNISSLASFSTRSPTRSWSLRC